MYANDNKGWLPEPRAYNKSNIAAQPVFDDSYLCMTGMSPAPAFPDFENNPNFGNGAGLGRLFVHNYIKDYRILTCPNLQEAVFLNNMKRPAYFFNPHWARAIEDNSKLTPRYKKLRDIPKDRSLIFEFFYNESTIAHHEPREASAYFNAAFPDGHVATHKNKTARDRAAIAGWDPSRGADAIGIIEFMDAGRTLDKTLGKAWDPAFEDRVYYSQWPAVKN
jgi:hypothetical protein